jgi:hypothetical protein
MTRETCNRNNQISFRRVLQKTFNSKEQFVCSHKCCASPIVRILKVVLFYLSIMKHRNNMFSQIYRTILCNNSFILSLKRFSLVEFEPGSSSRGADAVSILPHCQDEDFKALIPNSSLIDVYIFLCYSLIDVYILRKPHFAFCLSETAAQNSSF